MTSNIDRRFAQLGVSDEGFEKATQVRAAVRTLADLLDTVPSNHELEVALDKLEELQGWAIRAIARPPTAKEPPAKEPDERPGLTAAAHLSSSERARSMEPDTYTFGFNRRRW